MLMDPDAILRATEFLDDTMFYREGHRRIFRAMVSLSERGDVVDPLTLSEELGRSGSLESSGGKYYNYGNVFGWNSGRARFRTISAGIHHVAAQFANSSIYSGKGTMDILRTYNPARIAYPKRVMRFIEQLPVEVAASMAK